MPKDAWSKGSELKLQSMLLRHSAGRRRSSTLRCCSAHVGRLGAAHPGGAGVLMIAWSKGSSLKLLTLLIRHCAAAAQQDFALLQC